ncbi:uncharacterized protein A1O5_11315 [Cladophialophora psammophila CBS 110553]|uniref:Xylanolytic transcriptional activator regulatory domain-containing protein n=1 Tax=Cladophialophora psammophila CBS 110553 TaxID=1182543 RepID=W9WZ77_9EURO|nr:uncharacterized protein A1O5_11315 [Cladophialophora psammophila CBS 110553]EXJ63554.1 hypothetical protein A1O5_11315 [Cladophialophora psammophila CBS 110553]
MQPCAYPEKQLRPGPKIGSTQNPRKRKSRSEPDKDGQPRSTRRPPSTTERDGFQTSGNWTTASNDASSDVGSTSSGRQATNIESLSFIIHPSHESCSPEKRSKDDSPRCNGQSQQESHVAASCYSLGFHPEDLEGLIDQFFENFASFQLFREPEFRHMLQQIETPNQCKALLAAILIFATKDHEQCGDGNIRSETDEKAPSSGFINQALKYVDQAIYECEDMPISLPLLQALILITHWLLTQGVRGRAWRYLRVAVSSAYELNMHLIDANNCYDDQVDSAQWCEEEERRRAWWAIWEMDVFASVIRRCPTAIDWSQNETFLPSEDENWLKGEPQKSCTLRLDIIERYKVLEATGNQSPKAWFIVINSLMKDAQNITSPIGVDKAPVSNGQPRANQNSVEVSDAGRGGRRKATPDKQSLNLLCMIQNALQCTVMTLPKPHSYRYQYLSFGTRELDRQVIIKQRLQHCSIYSIHAMVQLTKLMIYKYHHFHSTPGESSRNSNGQRSIHSSHQAMQSQALEHCSEAADEIVALVGRSYEEHYKYVNPFLANTIWLAGAVQLLYRELAPLDRSDRDLANSKLEVLSMTYNRFVGYWNMSSTLQKNLEVIESEIDNLRNAAGKNDIAEGSRAHETDQRLPIAKRRTYSNSPTAQSCNGPNRGDGRNHGGMSAYSGNHTRTQTSTMNTQKAALSAINEGSTQPHSDLAGFGPVDACSFGNSSVLQQESMQQAPQDGVPNQVRPLPDSTSAAVQPMPMLSDNMPTSDLVRQGSSLSFYNSIDMQPDLSPDFLAGIPFASDLIGSNNHLSTYFGEILSGRPMA